MVILRYLASQVLAAMLAISLVLLLVFTSARFVRYLEQAALKFGVGVKTRTN